MIFFAVTGALLLGVLALFRAVLAPFLLGLIVAYVLAPLADRLQRIRLGAFEVPRWAGVLLIYAALLSSLATALVFGAPRLGAELQRVGREMPRTLHTIQEEWTPHVEHALRGAVSLSGAPNGPPAEGDNRAPSAASPDTLRVVPHPEGGYEIHLPANGIEVRARGENEYRIQVARDPRPDRKRDLSAVLIQSLRRAFTDTEHYAGTALRHLQTVVASVVGGVFSFFLMLMLSAYMLITKDQILGFFRSLARPERRRRFDDLLARIDRGLAGVVRGQLLIALVNGVLSGVGFWLAELRYWPVLTVIATLLSIIPIFGAIISSIPAVLVGLQSGVGTALFVLLWIIGVHQLEANVLNPKIMGDAAKVHPVLVVFALLAGEHLFGIAGALLAVPVLSITQSVFLHFREVALGVPRDASMAAQWSEAVLDPPGDDGQR